MPSSRIVSGTVNFPTAVTGEAFKGKTALVTGGSRGVGAHVTKALAEAGVFVTIADVDADAGQKYAFTLINEGLRVEFVKTDVRDWNSQVSAFRQCIKHSPNHTIDIVVACADSDCSPFLEAPFVDTYSSTDPQPPSLDVLNVNLIGSLYTAALAVQLFRKSSTSPDASGQADKHLILMSSGAAHTPVPLQPARTMSEMGLRGLWKSLRSYPNLTGMRINLIELPFVLRSPESAAALVVMKTHARPTKIQEVVDVVIRVVCDERIRGRAIQVVPGSEAIDLFDKNEADGSRGGILDDSELGRPTTGGSLEESRRTRQMTNDQNQRGEKRKFSEASPYLTVPPHARPKVISLPSDKEIKQMYSCLQYQSAT